MKSRIKIDSAILSFIIILTGLLYCYPFLYPFGPRGDNVLDFLGLIVVLKGTFLRMAARGHKKAHSQQGKGLVMTGPYRLVRNPMYLGSFLMGAGFVLIVWPWWSLPIFGILFYLRFCQQVIKEEKHLGEVFGKVYADYCSNVPRAFPRWSDFQKMKYSEIYPPDEVWNTKEVRGFVTWPILAVLLETFQELVVFGSTNILQTISIFILAGLTCTLLIWSLYKIKG